MILICFPLHTHIYKHIHIITFIFFVTIICVIKVIVHGLGVDVAYRLSNQTPRHWTVLEERQGPYGC